MSKNNFSGFIDYLEGGVLTGWVAIVGDNTPIRIAVYNNLGDLLGVTTADLYREDLKNASINNGNHGFKLLLNHELLLDSKSLEIREYSSEQSIIIHNVRSDSKKNKLHFNFTSLLNNRLEFIASSDIPGWEEKVVFSIGHEIITVASIKSKNRIYNGHIFIPAKFLDNQVKIITCHIDGDQFLSGIGEFKGNPIMTPLEVLSHSRLMPGLIIKPMVADRRYESLTLQMANLFKTKRDVNELSLIHTVLVESYEKRIDYPEFSLPKFENPEVSIIIPAYNKFSMTYHCIASIALAYNETTFEIILADDCSDDETTNIESIIKNIVVSRNQENLRFLRNCNIASYKAKGKYIIFLNNDTEVTSYWIDELVYQHKNNDKVGLTGSKLVNSDGTLQEAGGIIWGNGEPWNVGRNHNPFSPEWNYVREADYVTGAAMCIRKDIWEKVERFSEEFAPCYYEDADLAFKVASAGYKVLYVPHSEVVHLEGQSNGSDITKGLKRFQVINESTFRRKWFKVYKNYPKPDLKKLLTEKDRKIDQRILVIDYATPMKGIDAGSYAAIQEIKLMIALGFKVTFVPENLAPFGKYTKILQNMGVEVLYSPFYYSLDHIIDTRLDEMDGVYITRYDVAKKYIDKIKEKNKPILFNNADLHFLREIRAAISSNDEILLEGAAVTRGLELEVCRKVDAVLTYNHTEHAVITSHNMEMTNLHITPWVLDSKDAGPTFLSREGIAFLGGYNHKPNVEAVEFMIKQVMPLLSVRRPDIKFYIYGSKMPDFFESYAADNVILKGFVESLDSVYHNHRIFVAPLLSGAGIKGKVLDAMSYGTPTVLTDVAAEGTGLINSLNTSIANDPSDWVDAIVSLYDDEVLWERFSKNSSLVAKENFSFNNGKNKMRKIFESVGLYSTVE